MARPAHRNHIEMMLRLIAEMVVIIARRFPALMAGQRIRSRQMPVLHSGVQPVARLTLERVALSALNLQRAVFVFSPVFLAALAIMLSSVWRFSVLAHPERGGALALLCRSILAQLSFRALAAHPVMAAIQGAVDVELRDRQPFARARAVLVAALLEGFRWEKRQLWGMILHVVTLLTGIGHAGECYKHSPGASIGLHLHFSTGEPI